MKKTGYAILGFIFSIGLAILISTADAAVFWVPTVSASSCIDNTRDEAQCKDCCDCNDGEAGDRSACRDTCATHDFSSNSNFITVNAHSRLGPNGDYSAATNTATEQACKEYCDGSPDLACGDRRYCRDKCNAKFSDQNNSNNSGISIEQAISDEAQRNTIAFDGLAFLTGDACADTFLPPGKVADFSGFQYLRDTDPTNLGHNTDFVTIIAFNMLNILTDSQISELVALARIQIDMINEYGYKRFPLMNAFRRLLEDDLPAGTVGLDKEAVMVYSAELYRLDGEISYGRAKTLGNILRGMSATQKAKLNALKALNGVGNWDKTLQNPLERLRIDRDLNVAVMTYASEMYSWYAGSVEADTYFCPERQGTYFGSFYMKDAPAMAPGAGFTIPSNLTAEMGASFLAALTPTQAALITNLVNLQREDLLAIVETRRAISTELRKFIQTATVDEAMVLALAEKYGELDGAIVYQYAENFTKVSDTLTSSQTAKLKQIRETWNTIPCTGAYMYSAKINMPEIENTDFLFGDTTNTRVTAGTLIKIADGFLFAEGPTGDSAGNLYFSDISTNRIYKRSAVGNLTVFRENSGGANGLYLDRMGNLVACEGTNARIVSFTPGGSLTVLADKYRSLPFNEPNDLWIDPRGGIYFSDPLYFKSTLSQDGQHVYYRMPNGDNLIRVISDMTRPNGLIGTPDGKLLYVADHGAGKTYRYNIGADGSLSNKTLFVSSGSDGMTIDNEGNVYLTTGNAIQVYSASGSLIETITVTDPTNLCFGGIDGKTLFITTKAAVYSIQMRVHGVSGLRSNPTPDIKANQSDGPLTIRQGTPLSLQISLMANDSVGLDVEWWVLAATATGWYSFDLSGSTALWRPGMVRTSLAPVRSLSAYTIDVSGVAMGESVFYFAVDSLVNGAVSLSEPVYFDSVRVKVE